MLLDFGLSTTYLLVVKGKNMSTFSADSTDVQGHMASMSNDVCEGNKGRSRLKLIVAKLSTSDREIAVEIV